MPKQKEPIWEAPFTFTRYCSCTELKTINVVEISPRGEFIYILLTLNCPHTLKDPSVVVRGYNRYDNYRDLYNAVREYMCNIDVVCPIVARKTCA